MKLNKAVDITIFIALLYCGFHFYEVNPNTFDIISITAMAYIVIRKPDINTITLILILMIERIADAIILFNFEQINAYIFYLSVATANMLIVVLILFRPWAASNYGPKSMRDNKNLAVTHQDMVLGFVLSIAVVFQLLALAEHTLRHLGDIGLDGLFGDWSPMFIRDIYQSMLFGFSIINFIILFYMTFDASKYKRHDNE
jgi:hypothetical protein